MQGRLIEGRLIAGLTLALHDDGSSMMFLLCSTVAWRQVLLHLRQVCDELLHATRDVVANLPHLRDGASLGIGEVPVDVALAGDVGAGVTAAHRDDNLCLLGQRARE